jgi:glycosyltransferase involved in cell wall biosynthesis
VSSSHQWLQVVTHLDPKYGGLSAAVPALSAALAAIPGQNVTLAAFCRNHERFIPREAAEKVTIHHFPIESGLRAGDERAANKFQCLVEAAAAIHIHGLWERSTMRAAWAAQSLKRPYVVSAHGMLERWALRQKRWKKAAYAAFIERPLLRKAACLHALTEAEAEDYRRFGLRNPIAVVPNGVTIPSKADPNLFLERFPHLKGKRLLLFLGRLHWKKGVHVLCESWAQIERRWPETHLVMAGPDCDNTRAGLEALCGRLGSKQVTFTGMLGGDLKWSALAAAEAFVLPSYSEGLSVSVLEAIGMGVPAIVSRQCNLPEIAKWNCGWEIETDCQSLTSALEICLRTAAAERKVMSENGRDVVARRYNWSVIGKDMASVYAWMSGGEQPKHLLTERSNRTSGFVTSKAASL